MLEMIEREMLAHKKVLEEMITELQNYIYMACMLSVDTLANDKKILIFGNGGSATDAQHLAAEIVGRYKRDRKGYAAIALTNDSATVTSIANDFGYAEVFARQIEALAVEGDLLIAISTSGKSENVIKALEMGRSLGCRIVGLSGNNGGAMNALCDVNVVVPSNDTPRIQEMHTLIGHLISQAIDSAGL